MVVYCDICNVTVSSETEMGMHIAGWKHKQSLKRVELRRKEVDRCLYVRGFPPTIPDAALVGYFEQFGHVHSVSCNGTRQFAIVQLVNPAHAEEALAQSTHNLDGWKLTVKRREMKQSQHQQKQHWQTNVPLSESLERLGSQKQLGQGPRSNQPPDNLEKQQQPLQDSHEKAYHTHQRRQKQPASAPNQIRHLADNEKPGCSTSTPTSQPTAKRKAKKMSMPQTENVVSIDHSAVMDILLKADNVDDQMGKLMACISLNAEDLQLREAIVNSFQAALEPFFPHCRMQQFGSSVNGFGIRGCDMDLFLELFIERRLEEERYKPISYYMYRRCPRLFVRDIKSLSNKKLPLTAQQLVNIPEYDCLKLIARVLCGYCADVKDTITIPSARCPVVKFTHISTGIKCDISVNNRIALRNTQLLRLYSETSPCVQPLVYMIRYWAKLREVAGNINSGPKLTNYSLTFLVLYYLQNASNGVIPTVEAMERLCGEEDRVYIDRWNCSFPHFYIPEHNIEESLSTLLCGFFRFFSKLDFRDVVISLREGTNVPIVNFRASVATGDERVKDFKYCPISVQDPFVLNHNITANVNEKTRIKLGQELSLAAEICYASSDWTESKPQDLSESADSKAKLWGLGLLLSAESLTQSPALSAANVKTLSGIEEAKKSSNYTFSHSLVSSQLSNNFMKELQGSDNFKLDWCFRVISFIRSVMESVIMLDCKLLSGGLENLVDMETDPKGGSVPDMSKSPESSPGASVGASRGKTLKRSFELATISGNRNFSPKRGILEVKSDIEDECSPFKKMSYENIDAEKLIPIRGSDQDPSKNIEKNHDLEIHPTIVLACSANFRIWSGHQTERRKLKLTYQEENLEFEQKVSEAIKNKQSLSNEVVISFACEMKAVSNSLKTEVIVKCLPLQGSKEFSCFFPFFKKQMKKLLEKYLL